MVSGKNLRWKHWLGVFLLLLVCFVSAGFQPSSRNTQPILVECPRRHSSKRIKTKVAKIVADLPKGASPDIRFVTASDQKLFAFYREGMVHMCTDRALEMIAKIYPPESLNPQNLKGKKILDLGCGQGSFVSDLRQKGFDAFGIDLFLEEHLIEEPYLTRQDLRRTSFEAETFDRVFCTYVLLKKDSYDTDFFRSGVTEALRVTREDATICIGPTQLDGDTMAELLKPFQARVRFKMVPVGANYAVGKGFRILVISKRSPKPTP